VFDIVSQNLFYPQKRRSSGRASRILQ